MVNYAATYDPMNNLDAVFGSLADATRRDILRRVAHCELTVSEIAAQYDLTLAAVSKHLKVLENAKLIIKQRRGKEKMVSLAPQAFRDVEHYLEWYRQRTEQRFDALEAYLKEDDKQRS
jgi:DNA-binding transcriptional ArsR family regulator